MSGAGNAQRSLPDARRDQHRPAYARRFSTVSASSLEARGLYSAKAKRERRFLRHLLQDGGDLLRRF